jgi:hypothetical protein
MNSMDDLNENSAARRRKSAFGIGGLAKHPLLESLPPHQREVILANAKKTDIDGDGDLTMDEWLVFQIQTVKDIEDNAKKQSKLENTIKWGGLWVVLGWLGNFGLVWAVVALTQKLSPRDGNLVDSNTGETLATRVGSHLPAIEPHPDFIERRLVIQENGDNEDDVRELVESTPLGQVPLSHEELRLQFDAFVDGHSVVIELEEGGPTKFYFKVDAVTSVTDGGEGTNTCDVYHNVDVLSGVDRYTVTVECCENVSHCDYYTNYESTLLVGEGRRLKGCIDAC